MISRIDRIGASFTKEGSLKTFPIQTPHLLDYIRAISRSIDWKARFTLVTRDRVIGLLFAHPATNRTI